MAIFDSLTRKFIFNQRYIRKIAREYTKELYELYGMVANRLADEPNNTRLQRAFQDVQKVFNYRLQELGVKMREDLLTFAEDENEFIHRVMSLNSTVILQLPDMGRIQRALESGDMQLLSNGSSQTLDEALQIFDDAQRKQLVRTIKDGMVIGKNALEIKNDIMRIVPTLARHQAEALTRTLHNFASSQVRNQFAIENQEVIDGEEWNSVLDVRTTLICGGRDGNVYPVGKGPKPPAHYNCRSQRIPILLDDFEDGEQKSRKKNFDQWLRAQDKDFQDNYFKQFPDGQEKAELFRKGNLEIQFFRDERGVEYSLEELRALHPIAYREADLNPPQ